MSRKNKLWAISARAKLMEAMGEVCVVCGETIDLTFDCITDMGSEHHRKDTSTRMCFYRRQFLHDNLQVLCRECNGRKGRLEHLAKAKHELGDNDAVVSPF